MTVIRDFIEQNFIPEDSCVFFSEEINYRTLRYLDLLRSSSNRLLPEAVIEVDNQPFMYLILQNTLGNPDNEHFRLGEALRRLACRADARFLGVVTPGIITIYPIEIYESIPDSIVSFDGMSSTFALRDFLTGEEWPDVGARQRNRAEQRWLDAFLLELLNSAANSLRERFLPSELSDASVLSLIGRALFSRFLSDRGIVSEKDARLIASGAQNLTRIYATPENAADTFRWLDETFNGDLLPLDPVEDYDDFFSRLQDKAEYVCRILTDIQYGAVDGQLELGWKGLRFEHIPIDVLSQVYENFYRRFLREQAKKESVHYTPRRLAELLVEGAFSALPENERSSARVLDPAVGAGVFLVLSLRRLVQEKWRASGIRPNRNDIRYILRSQLCGLDLNPEALKVAALSLYLACLELDPFPAPLSDLVFDRVTGTTLFCVSDDSLDDESGLGSLSPLLETTYPGIFPGSCAQDDRRKFDIVLGNPPWTSLRGKKGKNLEQVVRDSIKARGLPLPAAKDKVLRYHALDQPFVWKATEWAKEGGSIAFLLNSRLLFQHDSFLMRDLLFQAVRVTGILNGSALRNSMVWDSVTAPFCLLVAKNEKPRPGSRFYYLNPVVENAFTDRGMFRIDPSGAIPVPCELVRTSPTVLKTLFRGSSLDVAFINHLGVRPRVLLEAYLNELGLNFAVGYSQRSKERRVKDASMLQGLKQLKPKKDELLLYRICQDQLQDWPADLAKLHRPGKEENYRAPLLLFREAAKSDVRERGAIFSDFDVAYSESFYGISLKNAKLPAGLADYLYVLSYSSLLVYFQLMTSSQFAVEREVLQRMDYMSFPIVRWEEVSPEHKKEIKLIAKAIMADEEPWDRLDAVMGEIYGLSDADQQLIADALSFEMPHTTSRSAAAKRVGDNEISGFIDTLTALLRPFVDNGQLHIQRELRYQSASFEFFSVVTGQSNVPERDSTSVRVLSESLSESLFSSQIRIRISAGHWIIGQLAQSRYWSKTRARLLALEWIESGFFSGEQS